METGEVGSTGAFNRSNKMRRTPQKECTLVENGGSGCTASQKAAANADPQVTEKAEETPILSTRREGAKGSPRQNFILKMRNEEDAALAKCRKALREIKSAIKRQKNISKTVQDSVDEMTELFDVIASCRKTWQKAEEEAKGDNSRKATVTNNSNAETPNSSKRAASSPIKLDTGKKPRESELETEKEGWKTVTGRNQTNRKKAEGKTPLIEKRTRHRNATEKTTHTAPRTVTKNETPQEVILIRPAVDKTYADVLSTMKKTVNPAATETKVQTIRKTRAGDVLLVLDRTSKNARQFGIAVKNAIGDTGRVREIGTRTTIEIRDLDACTVKEDIEESLKTILTPSEPPWNVTIHGPNTRGQKMALLELDNQDAEKLLELSKIRVGWVVCRIRKRQAITRCFRCLGYGHISRQCDGPDRSTTCYKCGDKSHIARACKNELRKCVLCADLMVEEKHLHHTAGSAGCKAYRIAIESTRQKRK